MKHLGDTPAGRQVKGLALSLQRPGLLLWRGFSPRPGNFLMPQVQPNDFKELDGHRSNDKIQCVCLPDMAW